MPETRKTTRLEIGELSFSFRERVLVDLPDARAFLAHLIERGSVAPHTAAHYVKLVAKLRRQGRLDRPEEITHVTELTAVRAYARWHAESYLERLAPVRRFIPHERARLPFIRRHGLVPPAIGKMIPVVQLPVLSAMPPEVLASRPAEDSSFAPSTIEPVAPSPLNVVMMPAPNAWTLHIPHAVVAPHEDPCKTCTAIVLNEDQLSVIADAFAKTWGHQDLTRVPPEEFLFGTPPPEGDLAARRAVEKAVALVPDGLTRDELARGLRAQTTHDVNEFITRLNENVSGVYISRDTSGARLGDVLAAVWKAWGVEGATT